MSPTFALGYNFCVNLLSSFKENSNGDSPAGNGNQLIIFWEKELKFCLAVCNRDRYVWVFNGRGGGGGDSGLDFKPALVRNICCIN